MAKKYLDYLGLVHLWTLLKIKFANKVDKEDGKGLSTNDYTTTEKNKLAGIASGAEVNVQADWNQTTTTADDYIKNKPTIPDDSNLVHKTGNETIRGTKTFGSIEHHVPELIAGNTLQFDWIKIHADLTEDDLTLQQALDERNNVLADWNQTTTTAADYIKNKPSIPTATTTSPKMNGTAAVGSETKWAKGDHVHPSDTTKADKSATVSTVAYDTTNKKITKTINGTTTDVVTAAKIVTDGGGVTDVSGKVDKTTTVNGHALSGNVTVSKSDVGLGNVTNDAQIPLTQKGTVNGVCPLNASSKIDSTYLPSYVDDVIEAYARAGLTALSSTWLATGSASGTVITPESGKIYLLMSDSGDYSANTQFRYSGTTYVKLNDGGISEITNSEIDDIIEN